ncbi:MAG: SDR family oxidoreductase [Elusimicrobiota bacterium]
MYNFKKVIVTGANGFIGRNLCAFLKEKGYFVRGAVPDNVRDVSGVDEYVQVGDINESTDWTRALQGVDFVVHLAGRAHVMDECETDPAAIYHRVNVLATRRLAEQAVQSGVKRFIFLSSVKVNGENTARQSSARNSVFTEESQPDPKGYYAISKLEAEEKIISVCRKSNMQEVILRLPLVYGPGVKANFLQLIRLVDKGMPFPFGSVSNKRSFIYTGNLCDIIGLCLIHPSAARQLFLVSDGVDISTPQLIAIIAEGLKKKVLLLPCPVFMLRVIGLFTGKSDSIRRLTDSLCVQTAKLTNLTGWKPRFSVEEGIAGTVRFYKDTENEKSV